MGIGENIKEKRKRNGLTQKQLAEILGVSTITIQNYENNRRTPNIVMINSIADALGVSQHELMTGESLDSLKEALNKIDIEADRRLFNEKSKELRSKHAESEEFCLYDIDRMLYQTILDILTNAKESTTLEYELSNFSAEELDEIGRFVFNSYQLKVNEILERHKKEALLLNDGVKLATSKLSKKDLSYIENLSPEEQSEFLDRANELANKIINERNKEK